MSEKWWTEGPWVAEFSNCHVGQVAVCHGDGDGYWEVWTPNWSGGVDSEANANLIAAAPDLYEALEQAVTSMQDSGYPNSSVVMRAARAALAKARGEYE